MTPPIPLPLCRAFLLVGALAASLAACGPRTEIAKTEDQAPAAREANVTGAAADVGAAAVGELSTTQFIEAAAENNLYAVEAAEVVLMRSKTTEVRRIAQALADDALAASAKLRSLANGAELPTTLNERRRSALGELRQSTDRQFDARYLDQQTIAHHEALLLMSGYRAVGDLPVLRAYAAEVESRLRTRLDEIVTLSDALPDP